MLQELIEGPLCGKIEAPRHCQSAKDLHDSHEAHWLKHLASVLRVVKSFRFPRMSHLVVLEGRGGHQDHEDRTDAKEGEDLQRGSAVDGTMCLRHLPRDGEAGDGTDEAAQAQAHRIILALPALLPPLLVLHPLFLLALPVNPPDANLEAQDAQSKGDQGEDADDQPARQQPTEPEQELGVHLCSAKALDGGEARDVRKDRAEGLERDVWQLFHGERLRVMALRVHLVRRSLDQLLPLLL
mmetsp:Transcript_54203/g.126146  ORF Transcript_54203/g.126146 Transcript_54203/m.126146 type:complete len:240 (-) Transcript_54203:643-1362(-)